MRRRAPVGLSNYPILLQQWDVSNNGQLTPDDVSPSTKRKVWWRCGQGHEWKAAVYSRTSLGTSCPYCAGKRVGYNNSLGDLYPSLSAQWHPERNGIVTAFDVRPGSHKKAWWVCHHNHEWEASIRSRAKGRGCPHCSRIRRSEGGTCKVTPGNSLAVNRPDLVNEWARQKNFPLTPESVSVGSGRKVWWKCGQGHEWRARIQSRVLGRGCPYCSNQMVARDNSLAFLEPDLSREWHPTRSGCKTS
jgi:hypothetical protein